MSRVLIIDDSATERHVFTAWLAGMGHVVLEAQDAETGMALAIQQRPDMILMDVILPGKNGFEATRSLRKNAQTHAIPVMIISSKNQASDQAWGKKQGAVAYLTKPLTEQLFRQEIEKVLSSLPAPPKDP